LEKDEDLKSLRSLDEFKTLVQSLKQQNVPPVSVSVATTELSAPVEIHVEVKPDAPVNPVPSVQAPVPSAPADANLTLLLNMGFIDQQKNAEALARARGDLAAAVQILIGGQRSNRWN